MFREERLARWWESLTEFERLEVHWEVDARPLSDEVAEIIGRLSDRGAAITYTADGWQRVMPRWVQDFVRRH
jgi:hypothetical protein